jgi:hypothetical protein
MSKLKKPTPLNSGCHLSRYNAIKSGLFSDTPLLPWEDADEYAVLHAKYVSDFLPHGVAEARSVKKMADIEWCERRLRAAEAGATREALRQAVKEQLESASPSVRSFLQEILRGDGGDVDDLLRLVTMPLDAADAALNAIEEELHTVLTARQILGKSRDIDQALSILPKDFCEAYAAGICDRGLDPTANAATDGDDTEVQDGYMSERQVRLSALEYGLAVREAELAPKQIVLAHYREIHEAAQLKVVTSAASGNIARRERDHDGRYKNALSLLLNLQKFKRQAVAVDPD